MILLIDNYDSFVYNLARYTEELGYRCQVVRNDAITIDEIRDCHPSHIILSPGPCTPKEAGICVPLIQALHAQIPILGVCLGHQAIGEAFGGDTIRAQVPMHGKATLIHHDGQGLFQGMLNPLLVGRYHSLVIDKKTFPSDLRVTAHCPKSMDIMAVQHQRAPLYGVQFHPESVLTKFGQRLLHTFLKATSAL